MRVQLCGVFQSLGWPADSGVENERGVMVARCRSSRMHDIEYRAAACKASLPERNLFPSDMY